MDQWTIPIQFFFPTSLPDGWVFEKVSDLVQQVAEKEKVETAKEYRLIGVKWYGEGTFHRETVLGSETSATYLTPVIPNAVIYNRLFAWKESFAVVPKEHVGHYVSNEFPQFIVDEEHVLPTYLYLFFIQKPVIEIVNRASVGSAAVSRNRFKEEQFLSFVIPLPPLETQRSIVNRWQEAKSEIAETEQNIQAMEKEIEERFFDDLGLQIPQEKAKPKSFVVQWHDFERWSVSYNQAIQTSSDISTGNYPLVELGTILDRVQYGTSEKANTKGNGVPVIRMNNIVDGQLELSKLKHVKLRLSETENLLLEDGDILFNRTNSKELVGKCAVFHEKDVYVFASYLIRVRADRSKALPDYLSYALNSPIGRQQIDALSRQIIGQANINSQELRSLKIPLPPMAVQREIVARVEAARTEIRRLRQQSTETRQRMEIEIEQMILGVTLDPSTRL